MYSRGEIRETTPLTNSSTLGFTLLDENYSVTTVTHELLSQDREGTGMILAVLPLFYVAYLSM